VLAYGSCIDGNVCTTWSGCANSVSKTKILPDDAWASEKFSSVEMVVAPGAHTYYVMQSNYMGAPLAAAARPVRAGCMRHLPGCPAPRTGRWH
jgi:hypothetical protein